MTEESKNEETVNIEISHFASPLKTKDNPNQKDSNSKEESLGDTMKISIERKNNKKTINVNVNEITGTDKDGGDKIQIKIEKNNTKKERKESSRRENRESSKIVTASSSNRVRDVTNATNVTNNEAQPPVKSDRRDVYGTLIKKGGRRHKVTFSDLLKIKSPVEEFVKVVNVESYKAFNVDMSQDNFATTNKSTNCCGKGCLIY